MKKKMYLIQIESANMMVLDLETNQKEFNNQLVKVMEEWNNLYEKDENYRDEMGAKYSVVEREFNTFYETQYIIYDGLTRCWFIKRIAKSGYQFR